MPRNPSLARDAALRRMHRANRWLIAGTVVATGLLTDVAAQAFPGRTITRSTDPPTTAQAPRPRAYSARKRHRRETHHAVHHALRPPAQAPTAPTQEQTPTVAAAAPAPAPTTTAAPAPAPAPTPAAAPAPSTPAPTAPAPVVSGGSEPARGTAGLARRGRDRVLAGARHDGRPVHHGRRGARGSPCARRGRVGRDRPGVQPLSGRF